MQMLFTNEGIDARADEVVDYLRGPRLWIPQHDYPDYDDWLERVHAQLKNEQKRTLLALSSGRIIGAIVYQRHRSRPQAVEIKNITVRPEAQGRHVASFLLRNVEVEATRDYAGTTEILVDAKADNTGIRLFLLRHRYRIAAHQDLYALGAATDLVFTKPISTLTL